MDGAVTPFHGFPEGDLTDGGETRGTVFYGPFSVSLNSMGRHSGFVLACRRDLAGCSTYSLLLDYSAGMDTGNIVVDISMHGACYQQEKGVTRQVLSI